MKKIKYFLLLIILIALGILFAQNYDYFMAKHALEIDLKISSWKWTVPGIQNGLFFVACFLIGVIITAIKLLAVTLKFKKEIKAKDAAISSQKEQLNALKTELKVFQHDPYIKKELEQKTQNADEHGQKTDKDKTDTAD